MLRLVDSIHRDKGIDPDILYESLEQALLSAARRKHPDVEELRVRIDRESGDIRMLDGDRPLGLMDPAEFGRIAAQTAKQIMIQRIREAERDVVYNEYEHRVGELVNGTVQRVEHGTVAVNLGRTEGIIPRQEQIFNEEYHPGDTVRCYILEVKKRGQKVLIILSRTSPHLVRKLFEQEVPEIYDHTVEIKGLVREAGHRTKIAVASSDSRVDPVGACVGVRGSRIRNIVEELNGEKIDIVRWNESPELFIQNALSPAQIDTVIFDPYDPRARVTVPDDQLALAIGRKGQNVRLSSRLTGYELDIMTIQEHADLRARGRAEIESLPGVGDAIVNSMLLSGFESFDDIVKRGAEDLQEIKGIGEVKAQELVEFAQAGIEEREAARAARQAEERAAREAAREAEREMAAEAATRMGEGSEEAGIETAVEAAAEAGAPRRTPTEEELFGPAPAPETPEAETPAPETPAEETAEETAEDEETAGEPAGEAEAETTPEESEAVDESDKE
jgi:N utilization substance protein A